MFILKNVFLQERTSKGSSKSVLGDFPRLRSRDKAPLLPSVVLISDTCFATPSKGRVSYTREYQPIEPPICINETLIRSMVLARASFTTNLTRPCENIVSNDVGSSSRTADSFSKSLRCATDRVVDLFYTVNTLVKKRNSNVPVTNLASKLSEL
uniref:Uncharacterized protein n=1 Tax=Vespula pensylvanica TaxID=30213 RepID=A0A834NLV2_VESPE|nr:hypothetical protein H0235_013015 [Vespula pensylvanica]